MLERINGLLHTADIVIPSVLEQIQGEHFDYIIHDSMFGCGRLLSQILKIFRSCAVTFNGLIRPLPERIIVVSGRT